MIIHAISLDNKNLDYNYDGYQLTIELPKEYKKGDIIEFLVDDIAAPNDFKIYCETKNYKLLSIDELKYITIKIKI